MDVQNKWLVVNQRKIQNMIHVLETLRMQNVDLSGLTTFQDIKFLILSMQAEIEKSQKEINYLREILNKYHED